MEARESDHQDFVNHIKLQNGKKGLISESGPIQL